MTPRNADSRTIRKSLPSAWNLWKSIREWGVGSGEWGVGNKEGASSHSPLPNPHSPLNLKMRKFFELMETGVNLFGLEPAQTIATELLDVVGGHDRAVDDGATQRGLVDFVGLRQIPH